MTEKRNTNHLVSAAMLWAVVLSAAASVAVAAPADENLARDILDATGVEGGLIIHLGCGDGGLTAALRESYSYQVHGLDRDAANVRKARNYIRTQGLYGDVSVDRLSGNRLPYIENLANLVVASDLGDIPMAEVMRVLVPHGVAYVKKGDAWTKRVKPRPDEIDEWTHYLYDAGGNAVAHDSVVGPPRHLQWLGTPRWSRHHDRMASLSAMVSAGGRVFYIMDEGSRISIQLPSKWTLIARDAFNGSILWKHPIETWQSNLWPLKSGPTHLARRLIVQGDVVYASLGFAAPLTALDAATGEVLRTYKGTEALEEVIGRDGLLFCLVKKSPSELANYVPEHNVGDQARVRTEFVWDEKIRVVMALEADSGKVLWRKRTPVSPLTLAADAKRVFFHDGEKVVCVDDKTGEPLWTSTPVERRAKIQFNFGPKLVVQGGVALFAGGERSMTAFNTESGSELWSAPHARGGYQSPEDLLVTGGLVWSAPTTSGGDSGIFTGRDLLTGSVKSEFPPNVQTYWFHHRCYIAKATDRYLLTSRTGIEFVDYKKNDWDINHWVRGGCLYGIMPCNGLVYAPPHNCACYPETKLYGLNALAPASATRDLPTNAANVDRVERGPAFGQPLGNTASAGRADWPTYRHDASRSGSTKAQVAGDLQPSWQANLGGKLSSVVVSGGKLFVSSIDKHTVLALDEATGNTVWSYVTGGRVDSPPTVDQGRVLFGSVDGYVYCLRAADGELIWRFLAAPIDRRLMAFEQLESVWPVHGSVLVEDNVVSCVAGRSNFLDGGLRLYRLDAATGRKISETVIDETDPETGENIQARLQVLNTAVGLPDILSSDGRHVYMRSQQFDLAGHRQAIGPHSGVPAEQGSVQTGEAAHLFAPMGFLDDTWFHRSYWVYGRSFAGGHSGYYQAGRFAPSGRILVFNKDSVYGFGRKPQYYKWTTTMEHQLFASSKKAPELSTSDRRTGPSMIRIEKSESLNPAGTALAVEAWVYSEGPTGVVLAHGGPAQGYALVIQNSQPKFVVRTGQEKVSTATAQVNVVGKWTHLVGTLSADKQLRLYVNGKLSANAASSGLISGDPVQALQIGADEGGAVGKYRAPLGFNGAIDEVRVYHGELTADDVAARFTDPLQARPADATAVLACSFDNGDAKDTSGNGNHGEPSKTVRRYGGGRFGVAMRFASRPNRQGGSFVKHHWTQDVPLLVRAMVLADKTMFLAGPPDLMDEEETFDRIRNRDPKVWETLAEQDAALDGAKGAVLLAVSATDGNTTARYQLDSVPVWDGMAAANGRLYLSTIDGTVVCLGSP